MWRSERINSGTHLQVGRFILSGSSEDFFGKAAAHVWCCDVRLYEGHSRVLRNGARIGSWQLLLLREDSISRDPRAGLALTLQGQAGPRFRSKRG
jgi:hypothetical protein